MNRETYLNTRQNMLNEAQKLLDAGEQAAFEAKMKEIEKLDRDFENAARNQANLNALAGAAVGTMANAAGAHDARPFAAVDMTGSRPAHRRMSREEILASQAYHDAYFRRMCNDGEEPAGEEPAGGEDAGAGDDEAAAAEEFLHTTGMEGAPLPTQTLNQIWDLVNGTHALMGDVNMLRTGCQITVTKHTTIVKGKAKKTAEGEANDAEENTFVTVTLAGNDYSKFIDISYAMANMAIPAFENYLVQEISKQLGEAMTDDVYDVIEDGLAAANKMTVATSGTLTYAELCAAFGELERVDEVAIYGKRKAIFNYLVGMTDDNGRPVLQPDPTGKAVGVILGAPVKIEDSVAAGKLLIGDGKKVTYNLVTDIMIETDRDIKKHVITHSGYARGEAALVDDKGLTLLTVVSG